MNSEIESPELQKLTLSGSLLTWRSSLDSSVCVHPSLGTRRGLPQPRSGCLGICSLLLLSILLLLALASMMLVQWIQEHPSRWPAATEKSKVPVCKGAHAGLKDCARLLLQLLQGRGMLGVLASPALKMRQLACQPLQAIEGHALFCRAERPACLQDSQMRCTVHVSQLSPLAVALTALL